jgi:carbonic anhydrase
MRIPAELAAGYRRFRSERFVAEAARYQSLAKEQRPSTMVIACADSRVDPASIFSAAPGELFVVRNVAAIVPPFEETGTYHGTSAAIEFAVAGLSVANIVVMGHGMCGGIAAAFAAGENRPVGRFIGPWVELLGGIRDEVLDQTHPGNVQMRRKTLEQRAVQYSLQNLMSFGFVRSAVERGHLSLHGAWFSIGEGELEWLDWDTGTFERIAY